MMYYPQDEAQCSAQPMSCEPKQLKPHKHMHAISVANHLLDALQSCCMNEHACCETKAEHDCCCKCKCLISDAINCALEHITGCCDKKPNA